MRFVHLFYLSLFIPLCSAASLEDFALPLLCVSGLAIILALGIAAYIYYKGEDRGETQGSPEEPGTQESVRAPVHPEAKPEIRQKPGAKFLMALFVPAQKRNGWKSETRTRVFHISEN
ncbi:MAG: hypothetical protein PHS02_02400 [Candidatus ainarchaeum sp.]|nr:hypothetical protein [Candidatus ainarchaeum sp.]